MPYADSASIERKLGYRASLKLWSVLSNPWRVRIHTGTITLRGGWLREQPATTEINGPCVKVWGDMVSGISIDKLIVR